MDKFEDYIPKCSASNMIESHNIMLRRYKQLEKAYELTAIEFENYKKRARHNRNVFIRFYKWIKRVLRL